MEHRNYCQIKFLMIVYSKQQVEKCTTAIRVNALKIHNINYTKEKQYRETQTRMIIV